MHFEIRSHTAGRPRRVAIPGKKRTARVVRERKAVEQVVRSYFVSVDYLGKKPSVYEICRGVVDATPWLSNRLEKSTGQGYLGRFLTMAVRNQIQKSKEFSKSEKKMGNSATSGDAVTRMVKALTHKAYNETLQMGIPVMVAEGENIVRKYPDGKVEFIKKLPKKVSVPKELRSPND